jgi:glycosyltransferase involved in cell wall biosynthesis
LWTPKFKALGHDVVVTSPYAVTGGAVEWEGIKVLPGGMEMFGNDVIPGHYGWHRADLLLTLCDIYTIATDTLRDMNVAHWQPIDCDPMGYADRDCLAKSGAQPIAMSKFGERMMRDAGFSPYYIPHGIDTAVFSPPEDRQALRAELGVPEDMFLIGINGMNKNTRKNFPGQLTAFAEFHQRHPRSVLLLHTITSWKEGLDLMALARALGIGDAVKFPDQYAYVTGLLDTGMMARWYGALDLYSGCTLGEGFGLPLIEAQACGTPVVATDASAMSELAGPGWLVPGEKLWMHLHESWWRRPDPAGIAAAYEEAWQEFTDGTAQKRRDAAREFALPYDADRVLEESWVPVLAALEAKGTEGS